MDLDLNTLGPIKLFLTTNDLAKAIDNKTQIDMTISKAFNVSKYKVSTHYSKSLFLYQMCGVPLEITKQHSYLEFQCFE